MGISEMLGIILEYVSLTSSFSDLVEHVDNNVGVVGMGCSKLHPPPTGRYNHIHRGSVRLEASVEVVI
jgi:hypothetical protein